MSNQPPITRIDISRLGHTPDSTISLRFWYEGWQDGDAADNEELLDGARIEALLFQYEKQGFTVEMPDNNNARALRGKITRVDFLKLGPRYVVHKFPFGWTAKTRPLGGEIEMNLTDWHAAIEKCRQHPDWTVLDWPEGARAYRGKPMPIHDARTIRSMRILIDKTPGDPRKNYDLAYYW